MGALPHPTPATAVAGLIPLFRGAPPEPAPARAMTAQLPSPPPAWQPISQLPTVVVLIDYLHELVSVSRGRPRR